MWPLTTMGAEVFGLLLVRCLSFFVAGPIFAQRNIPMQFKVLLAVGISVSLFPMVSASGMTPSTDLGSFLLMVAGETLIGLILAFGVSIPFAGIKMAAGLIGIQMGFGIVNVMDPKSGTQIPILAKVYDLLAITLFLILNGHHLLLKGLGVSLNLVPLGGVEFSSGMVGQLIGMASSIFVIALSVGAPLIAVLFLTDAALGFVARTVPQMNIFIVGFPIKIALGLTGVAVTVPFFYRTVESLIGGIEQDLLILLRGM
jgi:flagellar biosynthesis protein FliR